MTAAYIILSDTRHLTLRGALAIALIRAGARLWNGGDALTIDVRAKPAATRLNPGEKRGGYSGSKPTSPIIVPASKGASVTPAAHDGDQPTSCG